MRTSSGVGNGKDSVVEDWQPQTFLRVQTVHFLLGGTGRLQYRLANDPSGLRTELFSGNAREEVIAYSLVI